jgi:vacuolar protein sorting-associated protein 52
LQKEPIEALLRSLLLVFMDNATSEYAFLKTFFPPEPLASEVDSEQYNALLSPRSVLSGEDRSAAGSDYGGIRSRTNSISAPPPIMPSLAPPKDDKSNMDATWKQIFDPVLEYITVRTPRHSCDTPV